MEFFPTSASDSILHRYFDEVGDLKWLIARVVMSSPAAVTFNAIDVDDWDHDLNARVAGQFDLLGLADLYSRQAARETTDIRQNLQRHFDYGGVDAVREELEHQWRSRQANRVNSWQTATYEALAKSDWFCEGKFA